MSFVPRRAVVTALGLASLALASAGGCLAFDGAEELLGGGGGTAGAGGQGTATTASTGGGGSGGGVTVGPCCDPASTDTCLVGDADGTCVYVLESCECSDCADTAACTEGLCTTDGVCDEVYDSCTCPDCDGASFCGPTACDSSDGICKPFYEGCMCPDCAAVNLECADNILACHGGSPNNVCELMTQADESCACPDCIGRPLCEGTSCNDDGTCDVTEPCTLCADCASDAKCASCETDFICYLPSESCGCADCNGQCP